MKSEAGRPISSIQTSTRLSQSWPPNSSLKKLDACLFFFSAFSSENSFPFYSIRVNLSLLSSIRDTYQMKLKDAIAINPNKFIKVSKKMNHFPL